MSEETQKPQRGENNNGADRLAIPRADKDAVEIVPSRQSGNTAGQQRMIAEAIRRAREMALLPFTVQEMGSDRREFSGRRERYAPRNTEQTAPAPAPAPAADKE